MSQRVTPYTADDLALTALLRIVPTGYRLIDVGDTRFGGVREKFVRLALRHVGPRPSLVGFVEPDADAAAAARAAADWAAQNLVPNAIQRRVTPSVLVVAPLSQAAAGPVADTPVRASVLVVDEGARVRGGTPPGCPSPQVIRDAAARLERGEPAPSIGSIDVAERTLMYGRGRRGFYDSPVLTIVGVLAVLGLLSRVPRLLIELRTGGLPGQLVAADALFALGLVAVAGLAFNIGGLREQAPGFNSPSQRIAVGSWVGLLIVVVAGSYALQTMVSLPAANGRGGTGGTCTTNCVPITADDNGKTINVSQDVGIDLRLPGTSCPRNSDPQVLDFRGCSPNGSGITAAYDAVGPGTAVLSRPVTGGEPTFSVTIVVR